MSDPFVAEIRIFPFKFAPLGWAFCNGQIMPISQNTALFSLLGTSYGGNGTTTYALPNLANSAPMQPGQGAGLSERDLGETGGSEAVTLLVAEIPAHTHELRAAAGQAGNTNTPTNNVLAVSQNGNAYTAVIQATPMASESLFAAGGDKPHNNMQPFLALNFCIAMQGNFPPRP